MSLRAKTMSGTYFIRGKARKVARDYFQHKDRSNIPIIVFVLYQDGRIAGFVLLRCLSVSRVYTETNAGFIS